MNKPKLLKKALFATTLFIFGLGICFISFLMLADHFDRIRQANPLNDPPLNLDYYQIDPATLFVDLENKGDNAFQPVEGKPNDTEHISGSFPWSSADYLTVANAHHNYLVSEPVSDAWKTYGYGVFRINQCRDKMQGFDSARIIFYMKEQSSFPVTYMEIEPLKGFIYSTSLEYQRANYQGLLEKLLLDPDSNFEEAKSLQGEINAEGALQIAESAGGEELRQKLSNIGCDLRVVYYDSRWVVWYYWKTRDLRFTIDFEIDAEDGSYKIEQDLDRCERVVCP